MRFFIAAGDGGSNLIRTDGTKEPLLPQGMTISGETLEVRFSESTALVFAAHALGDWPELQIQAVLGETVLGLELPYKPVKSSRIHDRGDGQFEVVADTGMSYRFTRTLLDSERRALALHQEAPFIAYQAVPEEQSFSLTNFTLPEAQDREAYRSSINRFRDQSFQLWAKSVASGNNEDLVIAYAGEAVRRGIYREAIAAVPQAFLSGTQRTYESTVFLGQLDRGLRSLTAGEREKVNRLTQLLAEGSPEFLQEPHVVEYLAVRGHRSVLEKGVQFLNTLNPASVSVPVLPGIFEGYMDWLEHRPLIEKLGITENPFERFMDQMYFIISQQLGRSTQGVLVWYEGKADMAFNLRLGKALAVYAEQAGVQDWAAIGRSLVLTVLSMSVDGGSVPAGLLMAETGEVSEDASVPRLSSAALYRLLSPGDNAPRAVSISGGTPVVWVWTGASAISVSQGNAMLDIAITFPVEQIHYLLICGVPRPSRIQIHDMDYRTAPDFERYNSSGWAYSASEQTLLLKMRHRNQVEHVRIFY
jgi:hypothetical protein